MNPARRGTPESEAVASSEDERPWPSSMSFGKFPLKEDSVPGLPGGIWSQKRPSFKMEMAPRPAVAVARDVRLGAVNPAHAAAFRGTPSPSSTGDGSGSLPFAIPLQPTPKAGRSLSHSQGQREVLQGAGGAHAGAGAGQGAALPLGLLTEEVDTESDSDLENVLTHTNSHPPIGSLMRTTTLPATYRGYQGPSNGRDHPNGRSPPHQGVSRGKTFESAFSPISLEHPRHRAQWQSHLGWDVPAGINESRRHSLADIPTRRGSVAGGEPSHLSRSYTINDAIEDEPAQYQQFGPDRAIDTANDPQHVGSRAQRTPNIIPPMYIAPPVELTAHEQGEMDAQRQVTQGIHWGPGTGRPKKQLYVVSFKCSRVDVFYLLDNTGLAVNEGDMVIVEADRGQDLGTVQHAKVTPDAARLLKKKYSEEQYKWLMMYSRNKEGGLNPNAQLHGESEGFGRLFPDAPTTMQGTIPRDNYNNLKPKAIKRLANDHEIKMLAEKEGNEAKAKRTCQQKVAHLRLQMEILDAEWQWDFQKLIFYYYADHYINFKDLITELYRIYKTRIWLSAINPASFSQHAMGQPPSGIGPGAVAPFNPYAMNNSYTMAYGEDRDPYGAQMPYRIPYETYTPNYPAIPGVSNSFAPAQFPNGQNYLFYGPGPGNGQNQGMTSSPQIADDTTPTSAQGPAPRSSNLMDYNFFPSNDEHYSMGVGKDAAQPMASMMSDMANVSLSDPFSKQFGTGFAPPYNGQAQTGAGQQAPGAQNSPWTAKVPNSAGGMGRPNVLPNPIGTARPPSQCQEYGALADNQRRATVDFASSQFRGLDTTQAAMGRPNFLADSAHPSNTGNDSRANVVQAFNYQNVAKGSRRDREEAAGRVGTMDRYFSQLPPPTDIGNMHADEMSRER